MNRGPANRLFRPLFDASFRPWGWIETGPATSESSETETLPPAVAGPHFRGLKPGAAVAVAHRAAATVVLWDN
ncbi:UNVERIFIED_ORG: hypothetical protein ABIB52_000069 [Arthrobacter sp. UYCu721]